LDNPHDDDDWEDSHSIKQKNPDGRKKDRKTLKISSNDLPSNITEKVTMSSVIAKMIEKDLDIDRFIKLHDNLKIQNHC